MNIPVKFSLYTGDFNLKGSLAKVTEVTRTLVWVKPSIGENLLVGDIGCHVSGIHHSFQLGCIVATVEVRNEQRAYYNDDWNRAVLHARSSGWDLVGYTPPTS